MKALGLCLACVLAASCASELDTTREPVDKGSFGTTVVTLVCKRIAYLEDLGDGDSRVDVRGDTYRELCRDGLEPPAGAPIPLRALQAVRDPLIGAIDAAMPEAFLPEVQALLTTEEFLSVYDDGTAIAAVDGLVEMLRAAADDPELPKTLERLGHRVGYRPLTPALGAMRAVVRYPDLHDFMVAFLDAVAEDGGSRAEWNQLLAALGIALRNAAAADEPDSADRTGVLARELLLRERSLLGTSTAIPLVRRDVRGLARVASAGAGLPAPFVDGDGDGLADVDDLGRFVNEDGEAVAAPAPFAAPPGEVAETWPHRDAQGRALTSADGALVYDYVDVDKTLLAALARDAGKLFDPQKPAALDAVRGASALMGPRQMATRTYDSGERIEYLGYDTGASPLLDMLHGYLQLLRYPQIDDVLALARELFVSHEAELSQLAEAVIDAARIGDLYPGLSIDPEAPLWDDLMPVVRQILATPGLAEDVMEALERPEIAQLGPLLADYMTYKDQFGYDPDTQEVVGSLGTVVDRSQPDTNFNRSLLQRLLHLIADSAGHVLCNKQDASVQILDLDVATYDECELLQIDDVAVFYVQSMAYLRDSDGDFVYEDGEPVPAAEFPFNWGWIGPFVTDGIIESLVGIDGFRSHPTPQALNRTLLLDPTPPRLADMITPPVCRDGHLYKTGHGGSLPVWEATGFYDVVQPLVQPFVDHGAEHLFVELMVILHNHWPSRDSLNHQHRLPGEPNYAYASNIAAYEPLMAAIFEENTLLPALVDTLPELDTAGVNGRDFTDIVLDAARYVLAPQVGLHKRDGSTQSTTADGRPITTLSPWHVLADAYVRKREHLEGQQAGGEAWQRAVSGIVDALMRGDEVPGEGWRFRNPRIRGEAVALIDFLRARMDAHRAAGDFDTWLGQDLVARAEDMLASPVAAAAADFIASLDASPEAREELASLVRHLTSAGYEEEFRTMLTATADLLQLALDDRDIVPMARFVGQALEPERGWVDRALVFVHRAAQSDRDQALVKLLRNMYEPYRTGRTAISDILDAVSEVHRTRPYEELGARYTASDYRTLLRGVAQFLDDEKRGLRKFIAIIEGRKL